MVPEASAHRLRDVQKLVYDRLRLLFIAKPVELFGDDLNHVMRLHAERSLKHARESMAARERPRGMASCGPDKLDAGEIVLYARLFRYQSRAFLDVRRVMILDHELRLGRKELIDSLS